ncbi:Tad domain-containing protein [Arthrobacter sp. MSA 4-2]|uniref:TadE/TadG family type IV pilus assembly protein n=1 Tax=Arthrobacter sp. MSA 4-2 TaxID=2794349 RepID=UPI0018E73C67|nr:TadE/TadG family type IV pilus assembly protein [Arthrobacter sp. MSA 4-2]MBJ2120508.1 Tad domain-containing protein [Arthrobacter sp. MSA 4-2]
MRRLTASSQLSRTDKLGFEKNERGASTVIVAVLMVVLLGFAALVVDVGGMYAEKAQLQSGADSAALAIAGDCARAGGICPPGVADTGTAMANGNANDGSSGVTSITFPAPRTVRVETNARNAATGANVLPLRFAQIFGISTSDIRASAEAAWGPPSGGSSFPWTVSECVFRQFLSSSQRAELDATGNFTGDPSSAPVLLRYDEGTPEYPGCRTQNGYMPGGFGWLETTGPGCTTTITTIGTAATVNGQPGNNYPNADACRSMVPTLLNEPILIPLFRSATGNGRNATYTLIGFAALEITAFKLGGGVASNPAPADCEGNCRAIAGRFTRFVSLDDGMPVAPGLPNYGASVVSLTR